MRREGIYIYIKKFEGIENWWYYTASRSKTVADSSKIIPQNRPPTSIPKHLFVSVPNLDESSSPLILLQV